MLRKCRNNKTKMGEQEAKVESHVRLSLASKVIAGVGKLSFRLTSQMVEVLAYLIAQWQI